MSEPLKSTLQPESIRAGIPVAIRVVDSARRTVYESAGADKIVA